MIKKVWLWLTCLILFLSFLGCDAALPTSVKGGVPVINSFYAVPPQISTGESSMLSWNVHVAGFTAHHTLRVFLLWDNENVEVERGGVLEVYPKVITIYTLTADVGSSSVSKSVTVFVESLGEK